MAKTSASQLKDKSVNEIKQLLGNLLENYFELLDEFQSKPWLQQLDDWKIYVAAISDILAADTNKIEGITNEDQVQNLVSSLCKALVPPGYTYEVLVPKTPKVLETGQEPIGWCEIGSKPANFRVRFVFDTDLTICFIYIERIVYRDTPSR